MLGEWLAEQVITESNIKTIVVIYPGRFQPMGRHHAATYKKLAAKFGQSNTYIATSDKVKLPKSPLNFKEKRKVIFKHGIGNVKILIKQQKLLVSMIQKLRQFYLRLGQKICKKIQDFV